MFSNPLELPATRQRLYRLAQIQYFSPSVLTFALRKVGIIPSRSDWQWFIETFLLSLGITLFLSGVVFFFAYNWTSMNRFAKFATIESGLLIPVLFIVWQDLESLSGKLALLGASVLVGILLAVYGQIYQTGADVFTLFLTWALFIFPWVIVSRFAPLWFFLLLLANLTLILYWEQSIETVYSPSLFLLLYLLNGISFILYESAIKLRILWLSWHTWLGKIIFVMTLTTLVIPTLEAIIKLDKLGFFGHEKILSLTILIYLATTALALIYFSQQRRDLFLLATTLGGVLVTLTTLLAKWLPLDETIAWLVLSFIIIGEIYFVTNFLFDLAKKWEERDA